jgi:hypothetical protein
MAMRVVDRSVLLSPTDLTSFLACEHLTMLELRTARGELERPSGPVLTPPSAATPPSVADVAESNRVWREGTKLAQISRAKKRPRVGTIFSFTLNEPATVKLTFTRPATGRTVELKCVASTHKNRRRKSCKRAVAAARFHSLDTLAGTRLPLRGGSRALSSSSQAATPS